MPTILSTALHDAAHSRESYRHQPIQTTHIRTGAAMFKNIEHAATVFGPAQIGVMTLTFKYDLDPYEAVRRMKKLVRKFTPLFRSWLWVMDFGNDTRPHFHLLVATHQDIRAGFDPSAYDTLKALSAQVRAEGREFTPAETQLANALKKSLKANPALKALQRDVRKLISSPRMRFGYQFELTPLRKTPDHVAGYFRKNYLNAVRARHGCFPGVHLTACSRNFPKVCWSTFTLTSSKARFEYGAIADALGIPDMEALKHRFGSKWPRDLAPVIDELRIRFSKDPSRWPAWGIQEAIAAHIG